MIIVFTVVFISYHLMVMGKLFPLFINLFTMYYLLIKFWFLLCILVDIIRNRAGLEICICLFLFQFLTVDYFLFNSISIFCGYCCNLLPYFETNIRGYSVLLYTHKFLVKVWVRLGLYVWPPQFTKRPSINEVC